MDSKFSSLRDAFNALDSKKILNDASSSLVPKKGNEKTPSIVAAADDESTNYFIEVEKCRTRISEKLRNFESDTLRLDSEEEFGIKSRYLEDQFIRAKTILPTIYYIRNLNLPDVNNEILKVDESLKSVAKVTKSSLKEMDDKGDDELNINDEVLDELHENMTQLYENTRRVNKISNEFEQYKEFQMKCQNVTNDFIKKMKEQIQGKYNNLLSQINSFESKIEVLKAQNDELEKVLKEQTNIEKHIRQMVNDKFKDSLNQLGSYIEKQDRQLIELKENLKQETGINVKIKQIYDELSTKRLASDPFVRRRGMNLVKGLLKDLDENDMLIQEQMEKELLESLNEWKEQQNKNDELLHRKDLVHQKVEDLKKSITEELQRIRSEKIIYKESTDRLKKTDTENSATLKKLEDLIAEKARQERREYYLKNKNKLKRKKNRHHQQLNKGRLSIETDGDGDEEGQGPANLSNEEYIKKLEKKVLNQQSDSVSGQGKTSQSSPYPLAPHDNLYSKSPISNFSSPNKIMDDSIIESEFETPDQISNASSHSSIRDGSLDGSTHGSSTDSSGDSNSNSDEEDESDDDEGDYREKGKDYKNQKNQTSNQQYETKNEGLLRSPDSRAKSPGRPVDKIEFYLGVQENDVTRIEMIKDQSLKKKKLDRDQLNLRLKNKSLKTQSPNKDSLPVKIQTQSSMAYEGQQGNSILSELCTACFIEYYQNSNDSQKNMKRLGPSSRASRATTRFAERKLRNRFHPNQKSIVLESLNSYQFSVQESAAVVDAVLTSIEKMNYFDPTLLKNWRQSQKFLKRFSKVNQLNFYIDENVLLQLHILCLEILDRILSLCPKYLVVKNNRLVFIDISKHVFALLGVLYNCTLFFWAPPLKVWHLKDRQLGFCIHRFCELIYSRGRYSPPSPVPLSFSAAVKQNVSLFERKEGFYYEDKPFALQLRAYTALFLSEELKDQFVQSCADLDKLFRQVYKANPDRSEIIDNFDEKYILCSIFTIQAALLAQFYLNEDEVSLSLRDVVLDKIQLVAGPETPLDSIKESFFVEFSLFKDLALFEDLNDFLTSICPQVAPVVLLTELFRRTIEEEVTREGFIQSIHTSKANTAELQYLNPSLSTAEDIEFRKSREFKQSQLANIWNKSSLNEGISQEIPWLNAGDGGDLYPTKQMAEGGAELRDEFQGVLSSFLGKELESQKATGQLSHPAVMTMVDGSHPSQISKFRSSSQVFRSWLRDIETHVMVLCQKIYLLIWHPFLGYQEPNRNVPDFNSTSSEILLPEKLVHSIAGYIGKVKAIIKLKSPEGNKKIQELEPLFEQCLKGLEEARKQVHDASEAMTLPLKKKIQWLKSKIEMGLKESQVFTESISETNNEISRIKEELELVHSSLSMVEVDNNVQKRHRSKMHIQRLPPEIQTLILEHAAQEKYQQLSLERENHEDLRSQINELTNEIDSLSNQGLYLKDTSLSLDQPTRAMRRTLSFIAKHDYANHHLEPEISDLALRPIDGNQSKEESLQNYLTIKRLSDVMNTISADEIVKEHSTEIEPEIDLFLEGQSMKVKGPTSSFLKWPTRMTITRIRNLEKLKKSAASKSMYHRKSLATKLYGFARRVERGLFDITNYKGPLGTYQPVKPPIPSTTSLRERKSFLLNIGGKSFERTKQAISDSKDSRQLSSDEREEAGDLDRDSDSARSLLNRIKLSIRGDKKLIRKQKKAHAFLAPRSRPFRSVEIRKKEDQEFFKPVPMQDIFEGRQLESIEERDLFPINEEDSEGPLGSRSQLDQDSLDPIDLMTDDGSVSSTKSLNKKSLNVNQEQEKKKRYLRTSEKSLFTNFQSSLPFPGIVQGMPMQVLISLRKKRYEYKKSFYASLEAHQDPIVTESKDIEGDPSLHSGQEETNPDENINDKDIEFIESLLSSVHDHKSIFANTTKGSRHLGPFQSSSRRRLDNFILGDHLRLKPSQKKACHSIGSPSRKDPGDKKDFLQYSLTEEDITNIFSDDVNDVEEYLINKKESTQPTQSRPPPQSVKPSMPSPRVLSQHLSHQN